MPLGVRLPCVEDVYRLIDAIELEQRLDLIRDPPTLARLAPPESLGYSGSLREPVGGCVWSATLPCSDAQDAKMHGRVKPKLLLPQLQGSLRVCARNLELPSMDSNRSDRKMHPRHLEPVLDLDLVRAFGVVGCELPAAAPQLDPCKPVKRICCQKLVSLAPQVVFALEQRAGGIKVPLRNEHTTQHVCRLA